MPLWSRVTVGLALALALLGFAVFAGFQAYSKKLGPVVQAHGTTYYNGGPPAAPVPCKSESEIQAAIAQVNAKYDHLEGPSLKAFERRAAYLKGLPPLRVDEIYVVTEDDHLRVGDMVLFIGIKGSCVSNVFSFPAQLYREIYDAPRAG